MPLDKTYTTKEIAAICKISYPYARKLLRKYASVRIEKKVLYYSKDVLMKVKDEAKPRGGETNLGLTETEVNHRIVSMGANIREEFEGELDLLKQQFAGAIRNLNERIKTLEKDLNE